jgi:hypothetical protein
MEAQSIKAKHRWTASRLFKIGFRGFYGSLIGVVFAVIMWWPLSFDWDPDDNLFPPYSIPAYLDLGFGGLAIIIGLVSVGLMIASGIKAILSYGKSAA